MIKRRTQSSKQIRWTAADEKFSVSVSGFQFEFSNFTASYSVFYFFWFRFVSDFDIRISDLKISVQKVTAEKEELLCPVH